jgi:hypothetical protein
MPAGLKRDASGCYFLTPDFERVKADFKVGDKFCALDGRPGMSIIRIADDAVFFDAPGYSSIRCQIYSNDTANCGSVVYNSKATVAAKAIKMDASGGIRATLEFKAQ